MPGTHTRNGRASLAAAFAVLLACGSPGEGPVGVASVGMGDVGDTYGNVGTHDQGTGRVAADSALEAMDGKLSQPEAGHQGAVPDGASEAGADVAASLDVVGDWDADNAPDWAPWDVDEAANDVATADDAVDAGEAVPSDSDLGVDLVEDATKFLDGQPDSSAEDGTDSDSEAKGPGPDAGDAAKPQDVAACPSPPGSGCDDADPCTVDTCAAEGACIHTALECGDGNPCTADNCGSTGICAHVPLDCDDSNACTSDTCGGAGSCVHAAVDCSDGNPCTQDGCASDGLCLHVPAACDDGNACTVDSCAGPGGCFHAPVLCDDADICTIDACESGGTCLHAPLSCDDGKLCTTDSCAPKSGCLHAPVDCADDLVCTLDGCDPADGACTHSPQPDCAGTCSSGVPWWQGQKFSCKAFANSPGWQIAPGFVARVVAGAAQGFKQPNAIAWGGCGYGGKLYVVDLVAASVFAVDLMTGKVSVFSKGANWPSQPVLLTSVAWDQDGLLDGALYIGDQGTDNDGDAKVFRIDALGASQVFVGGPGPGLNDIFTMVFVNSPGYPVGLYIAGDTDGPSVDWGVVDKTANSMTFSKLRDAEGACVDQAGQFGGGLLVARPASGGYLGDDGIDHLLADGSKGASLISGVPGIHAPAIAPPGPFGGFLYAASWQSGEILSISPAGAASTFVSQLALSNYDGNILAFSPDGTALLVAESMAGRVVCVEANSGP